jgi:hypothetical protein
VRRATPDPVCGAARRERSLIPRDFDVRAPWAALTPSVHKVCPSQLPGGPRAEHCIISLAGTQSRPYLSANTAMPWDQTVIIQHVWSEQAGVVFGRISTWQRSLDLCDEPRCRDRRKGTGALSDRKAAGLCSPGVSDIGHLTSCVVKGRASTFGPAGMPTRPHPGLEHHFGAAWDQTLP